MHLERLWRWRVGVMAAVVGVIAAMLRFVGLGHPSTLVFDEVYYARGAYSLATLGFEGDWSGEDQAFAEGDYSGLSSTEGDYVVHPMVGKMLIALGIQIFGPTPYGWRFAGAVLGTVTVVLIALVARHLLQSTAWGTMAGLLLAVEGQHIVMSRTALLDIFLTFFVVCGFALLLVDRVYARRRLARGAAHTRVDQRLAWDAPLTGWGPRMGVRWWRLGAMVAFGLAAGVKWSGLYVAAAFLVLSVVWDAVDRRREGYMRWALGALVRAVPAGLASLIVIPLTYLATWLPWFRSENSYARNWAASHPGEGITWLPESVRSLVHYHQQMLDFHRGLDAEHNYATHPLGWIIQYRPTAFHYEDADAALCGADRCVSAIHALGHPLIWVAMLAALVWAIWRTVRHRDVLAATVALGVLASWLPWLAFADRPIFTFYTVVMSPFVVLTVVWAASRLARPQGQWTRRGVVLVVAYTGAVLVVAGFFAPIWTGMVISHDYWQSHMWLPSWV